MIHIVDGDAKDVASIMPIMSDAFDRRFGEAWTAAQCLSTLVLPDCQLLLAKDGDIVCGFAITRWVFEHEELLMIGVSRNHQRQQIGQNLLSEVINRGKAAGREKLFLEVRDGNPASSFYFKAGFVPIGRRKNYYKSAEGISPDAITMFIDL
ncbi:ribosomal-protein-alanine N-acetyltransferase [Sphingorhabdus rigui]|uniref:Ribosomal-protein-alanine N-acetyltransferase n=1 Tax=Sphingorhabdus rigui TaxID=1282858 RepID=A0A840B008_9SPHN|nr:GNAT family N-acetyltransferase [Sphingorhabdus rigui]MBB3942567.1 ribosomal-protein-alanine N-acetyltransferase [Sphingorhabdus rigui]